MLNSEPEWLPFHKFLRTLVWACAGLRNSSEEDRPAPSSWGLAGRMGDADRRGGAPRKVLATRCPSLSFAVSPLPCRLASHPPHPLLCGPQKADEPDQRK